MSSPPRSRTSLHLDLPLAPSHSLPNHSVSPSSSSPSHLSPHSSAHSDFINSTHRPSPHQASFDPLCHQPSSTRSQELDASATYVSSLRSPLSPSPVLDPLHSNAGLPHDHSPASHLIAGFTTIHEGLHHRRSRSSSRRSSEHRPSAFDSEPSRKPHVSSHFHNIYPDHPISLSSSSFWTHSAADQLFSDSVSASEMPIQPGPADPHAPHSNNTPSSSQTHIQNVPDPHRFPPSSRQHPSDYHTDATPDTSTDTIPEPAIHSSRTPALLNDSNDLHTDRARFPYTSSSRLPPRASGSTQCIPPDSDNIFYQTEAADFNDRHAKRPLVKRGTLSVAASVIRRTSMRVVNLAGNAIPDHLSGVHHSATRPLSGIELTDASTPMPNERQLPHTRLSDTDDGHPHVPSDNHATDPTSRAQLRGRTLGIFGPRNKLRLALFQLFKSSFVDPFIFLLIVLNAIILTVQSSKSVWDFPRPTAGYFHEWEDYALFGLFCIFTSVVQSVFPILEPNFCQLFIASLFCERAIHHIIF